MRHSARRIAVALLAAPIHAYRYLLSPLTPPACRFHPTCSAYALEALREHGPLKGLGLAMRRLARCHPIKWLGSGEGFDPVPLSKTNLSGRGSERSCEQQRNNASHFSWNRSG